MRDAKELEFDGIEAAIRRGVDKSQGAAQVLGMIAGDFGDELDQLSLHHDLEFDLRHRRPFEYLVIGVFIFAIVAIRPETTLFVLFMTYATLGAVFGIWRLGSRHPRNTVNYSPEMGEEEVIEEHEPQS